MELELTFCYKLLGLDTLQMKVGSVWLVTQGMVTVLGEILQKLKVVKLEKYKIHSVLRSLSVYEHSTDFALLKKKVI